MIRLVIFNHETNRLEYQTSWCKNQDNASKKAFKDILKWDLPNTLRIIVEEKNKEVEIKFCPHCARGVLRKLDERDIKIMGYHYSCTQCARGWKILSNGSWESLYSALKSIYTHSKVIDEQEHKMIGTYIMKLNRWAK